MRIHPTAIVSPGAELGNGVTVGPFAVIQDDVILDDEVEIGAHCVVTGPTRIGKGTRCYPFASVGQDPQDLKFKGERTELIIGERNVIREFATLHRGTAVGGGVTRIGNDCLLMAQSHVAHDCIVGNRVIFANGASLAGHVEVEDNVTLGAYVGVHQFCRVGQYAFLGAYAVVTKDPLPFARSAGHYAECFGINTVGLRRAKFTSEEIRALKRAFHLLLASRLNTAQAVAAIRAELGHEPRVAQLLAFIESSKRGVAKRSKFTKGEQEDTDAES